MENPKDILEKLLKSHDWWYMMSDDPKVYDKGAKQEEAIKLLKNKVGNEYDALYNKYAPEEFKTTVDYKYNPKNPKALEEQEDKIDTISMDIPLFIRMLEYAKEDAAEDVDLHDVTEKANLLCKERGILSMEDYDEIISSTEDKPLDESKEQESGLWVYSRGREETNKLKEIINNSDYYGEYNSEVGGFFFPESEDNYDKLEEDLTELFDKNNLDNYRFEGVFGLDESKQDQVFKELKPAKHEFVKRYGKDAEKVMVGRAKNLSNINEEETKFERSDNWKEFKNLVNWDSQPSGFRVFRVTIYDEDGNPSYEFATDDSEKEDMTSVTPGYYYECSWLKKK